MPDEVEIKFRVKNLNELIQKLKKAGFQQETSRTHERNTLFDFPGGRLRKKGELLRLRQYGPKWTLTHKAKGKSGRHKSREETETVVEDGEQMNAIITSLGLRPSFVYEKYRAEWSDGNGHVVLDETPVGSFGEIEGLADWIDKTAKTLGIGESQYITSSYAEVFADWKKQTHSPATDMTFSAVNADPDKV